MLNIRTALEAYVKQICNKSKLVTKDKEHLPWNLGHVAFWLYKHAKQGTVQAPLNWKNAVQMVAEERGIFDLPQTSVAKVSASMQLAAAEHSLQEVVAGFLAQQQRQGTQQLASPVSQQAQQTLKIAQNMQMGQHGGHAVQQPYLAQQASSQQKQQQQQLQSQQQQAMAQHQHLLQSPAALQLSSSHQMAGAGTDAAAGQEGKRPRKRARTAATVTPTVSAAPASGQQQQQQRAPVPEAPGISGIGLSPQLVPQPHLPGAAAAATHSLCRGQSHAGTQTHEHTAWQGTGDQQLPPGKAQAAAVVADEAQAAALAAGGAQAHAVVAAGAAVSGSKVKRPRGGSNTQRNAGRAVEAAAGMALAVAPGAAQSVVVGQPAAHARGPPLIHARPLPHAQHTQRGPSAHQAGAAGAEAAMGPGQTTLSPGPGQAVSPVQPGEALQACAVADTGALNQAEAGAAAGMNAGAGLQGVTENPRAGAAAGIQAAAELPSPSALRPLVRKWRENENLEARLRQHLAKLNGSETTSLRMHCAKDGMGWTLLDLVAYALALAKKGMPLHFEAAAQYVAGVVQQSGATPTRPSTGHSLTGTPGSNASASEHSARLARVSGKMASAYSKYKLEGFVEGLALMQRVTMSKMAAKHIKRSKVGKGLRQQEGRQQDTGNGQQQQLLLAAEGADSVALVAAVAQVSDIHMATAPGAQPSNQPAAAGRAEVTVPAFNQQQHSRSNARPGAASSAAAPRAGPAPAALVRTAAAARTLSPRVLAGPSSVQPVSPRPQPQQAQQQQQQARHQHPSQQQQQQQQAPPPPQQQQLDMRLPAPAALVHQPAGAVAHRIASAHALQPPAAGTARLGAVQGIKQEQTETGARTGAGATANATTTATTALDQHNNALPGSSQPPATGVTRADASRGTGTATGVHQPAAANAAAAIDFAPGLSPALLSALEPSLRVHLSQRHGLSRLCVHGGKEGLGWSVLELAGLALGQRQAQAAAAVPVDFDAAARTLARSRRVSVAPGVIAKVARAMANAHARYSLDAFLAQHAGGVRGLMHVRM